MAYTCEAYRLSAMMNTIVAEGEGEDVGTAQRILNILIRWGISLRPFWQTVNMHDDPSLYADSMSRRLFSCRQREFSLINVSST